MNRPKILVVKGPDYLRKAARRCLENNSLDVVSTESASEAISLIAAQVFDVLITLLPVRTDGDDLMLFAVARRCLPNLLIVVLAESLNVREAAMAVQLEIDVLVKPLNIDRLMELIQAREPVRESAACSYADQPKAKPDSRLVYEGCDDYRTIDQLRTR